MSEDPWRDALFVIPPAPTPVDLDEVLRVNAELRTPVDGQLAIDEDAEEAS
mgnify:CR=1 FL=1